MGFAPNRWDGLLTAMKGKGYSEEELLESGLALRSEKSGNLYDLLSGTCSCFPSSMCLGPM